MSRLLHDWGSDSADRSLHTAGPNNPDRNSSLDLLGPAAIGSGPSRSKESDAEQSSGWMELVKGGGYSEPSRAEPGRSRCAVLGRWRYPQPCPMLPLGYRTASRLPFMREASHCGRCTRVRFDGYPSPGS